MDEQDIPWWQSWRLADPRDEAVARKLVPYGNDPDEMVILENDPAIGCRTPMGDARIIPTAGPHAPKPLWTCFLNIANLARKAASDAS